MSEALSAAYVVGVLVTLGLSGLWIHMLNLWDTIGDDADIGLIVPLFLMALLWPIMVPTAIIVYVTRRIRNLQ